MLLTSALSKSWSQTACATASVKTGPEGSEVLDQSPDSQGTQSLATLPDGPSIDSLPESRSLLLAAIFLSQSVEANPGDNRANSSQVSSFTRVLGSLNLLKTWRRVETAIDYRGGGYLSEGEGSTSRGQLQQLQAAQRVFWPKTALTISDSLGNIPGGTFGSAWFGGASAYNLGTTSVGASLAPDPGIDQFIGSAGFAGFGQRTLANLSLAELTQSLTTRSSVTVAGAYGISDYWGNSPNFIDSAQFSALANYGYRLTPRSEIGVVYGYRSFHFPEKDAGNISTNVAQFDYSRIFSRRLQMQVGAGPEFSRIITPLSALGKEVNYVTNQVNVSAFGSLAYRLRRATMALSYDRLVTNGAGLFAGANTNLAEFSLSRRLLTSWQATVDAGYVGLTRIDQSVSLIPGDSYQYGFAGAAIRRRFGRFNLLASYQYNDESVDTYFCQANHPCNHLVQRNVVLFGIYWHSRPIHLDSGGGQSGEADSPDSSESNTSHFHVPSSDN